MAETTIIASIQLKTRSNYVQFIVIVTDGELQVMRNSDVIMQAVDVMCM